MQGFKSILMSVYTHVTMSVYGNHDNIATHNANYAVKHHGYV